MIIAQHALYSEPAHRHLLRNLHPRHRPRRLVERTELHRVDSIQQLKFHREVLVHVRDVADDDPALRRPRSPSKLAQTQIRVELEAIVRRRRRRIARAPARPRVRKPARFFDEHAREPPERVPLHQQANLRITRARGRRRARQDDDVRPRAVVAHEDDSHRLILLQSRVRLRVRRRRTHVRAIIKQLPRAHARRRRARSQRARPIPLVVRVGRPRQRHRRRRRRVPTPPDVPEVQARLGVRVLVQRVFARNERQRSNRLRDVHFRRRRRRFPRRAVTHIRGRRPSRSHRRGRDERDERGQGSRR